MNQKHTAGPWKTGSLMSQVVVWPDGWNAPLCIADCGTKRAPESVEEKCANARLIAAAVNSYAKHFADPLTAAEQDRLGMALDALGNLRDAMDLVTAQPGGLARIVDATGMSRLAYVAMMQEARAVLAGQKS